VTGVVSGAPAPLTIRFAVQADLTDIAALGAWSAESWSDEVIRHRVWVGSTAGGIVAALSMSLVTDVAEVRQITVAPWARRTGFGRTLLEHGVSWASNEGAQEVFLEVSAGNDAAIRLYESAGFTEIARRTDYYAPGDDALVYRRGTPGRF